MIIWLWLSIPYLSSWTLLARQSHGPIFLGPQQAVVPYLSDIPQDDIGDELGLYIMQEELDRIRSIGSNLTAGFRPPGLQVHKWYLLWGLQYLHRTYLRVLRPVTEGLLAIIPAAS